MQLETCPHCGHAFKASEHRYGHGFTEAFTPRMPSTRLAQEFTVRCPSCNIAFVSSTLRWFGIVTYSQLPWLFGALLALAVVIAWLT